MLSIIIKIRSFVWSMSNIRLVITILIFMVTFLQIMTCWGIVSPIQPEKHARERKTIQNEQASELGYDSTSSYENSKTKSMRRVTTADLNKGVIEKYDADGFVYAVKVSPDVGKPYYLLAVDQQGSLAEISDHDMAIPSWDVLTW